MSDFEQDFLQSVKVSAATPESASVPARASVPVQQVPASASVKPTVAPRQKSFYVHLCAYTVLGLIIVALGVGLGVALNRNAELEPYYNLCISDDDESEDDIDGGWYAEDEEVVDDTEEEDEGGGEDEEGGSGETEEIVDEDEDGSEGL